MGIDAYQAREYIQDLGGSIDVTSEPGLGSCFSVRIPLANAATGETTGNKPDPTDSGLQEGSHAVN